MVRRSIRRAVQNHARLQRRRPHGERAARRAVERWLPKGVIAHVQLNDRNRRGPGQGEQRFAPLLQRAARHGYAGDIAIEPFDYVPDGPGAAARAIGYIRGHPGSAGRLRRERKTQ